VTNPPPQSKEENKLTSNTSKPLPYSEVLEAYPTVHGKGRFAAMYMSLSMEHHII